MKSEDFKEFGVVIIESLKEEDKKTGTALHEEIIKYKKFIESNLSSYLYIVNSKAEFFEVLKNLIEKIKTDKFYPILHIEAHGSEYGIELASKEFVKWEEMIDLFREMNILLSNMLIIMMGLCVGMSIIRVINPSKRAPFRAVIGAVHEVDEVELLIGCETFYDNFFFSFDHIKSLNLMNSEIDEKKSTFHLMTAEKCFEKMSDPDRDPIFFTKLIDQQVEVEKIQNQGLKGKTDQEIRAFAESKLRNVFSELKTKEDFFLMNDLEE